MIMQEIAFSASSLGMPASRLAKYVNATQNTTGRAMHAIRGCGAYSGVAISSMLMSMTNTANAKDSAANSVSHMVVLW
jgi:hypothetical protein